MLLVHSGTIEKHLFLHTRGHQHKPSTLGADILRLKSTGMKMPPAELKLSLESSSPTPPPLSQKIDNATKPVRRIREATYGKTPGDFCCVCSLT